MIVGRQIFPGSLKPIFWVRADQGILLNGSTVQQWNDLSGYGNHVSQATAGNQPNWGNTINGRPAVGPFGVGKSTQVLQSAVVPNLSQPFTVFIVFQRTVVYTGNGVLFSMAAGNPQVVQTAVAGGLDLQWNNLSTSTNVQVNAQSLTSPLQEDMVVAPGVAVADLYFNGSLAGTAASSGGVTHPNAFVVGNQYLATTLSFGGVIGEIIAFNAVLSTQQRLALRAYQKNFWGTP